MQSAGANRRADDEMKIVPTPAPGESVLLLSSPLDRPTSAKCLPPPGAAASESDVITVSLDESVHRVTQNWRREAGGLPSRLAVIAIGEIDRSAIPDGGSGPTDRPSNVSTASVSSPGDLTGLGIKLSQCLSSWSADAKPTAVHFDSLTTLLQFADLKRVFQFVHVVTGRIESADAVGYFHLDPAAHDDQTVATLRGIFDGVYEYGSDGWRQP